jgi:hypothetical protein
MRRESVTHQDRACHRPGVSRPCRASQNPKKRIEPINNGVIVVFKQAAVPR